MSTQGNVTENIDKTKNYSLGFVKENDTNTVSGNAFVNGFREKPDPTKLNAPAFSVAGGGISIENMSGHSVGVSGQHIPGYGDRVTGSTTMNMLRTENHKVDLNAFTTHSMPKASPNFSTHGAGVDYAFKDRHGVNASVAHTPMFKQTDYSAGGRINLHQTPTSSLDLNLGMSRTDTAFSRGNWQKSGMLHFGKKF